MKIGDLVFDEDNDYGIIVGTEVDLYEDLYRIFFPTTIDGDTGITYTMCAAQVKEVVCEGR